jgi:hypothetical protein
MARSRPVLVISFGVLNLLLGCLLLFCGVCGAVSTTSSEKWTVNGRDITPEYQAYMEREVPAYTVERFADVGLRFFTAFGFLGSGVGLLLVTRWGQILAVLVALMSIVHQLLVVLWQVAFIGPARTRFLDSMPLLNLGFVGKMETIIVAGWATVFLLCNFIVIACLVLPSTWRAITVYGQGGNRADDEDQADRRRGAESWDDDEDDYDSRVRRSQRR